MNITTRVRETGHAATIDVVPAFGREGRVRCDCGKSFPSHWENRIGERWIDSPAWEVHVRRAREGRD